MRILHLFKSFNKFIFSKCSVQIFTDSFWDAITQFKHGLMSYFSVTPIWILCEFLWAKLFKIVIDVPVVFRNLRNTNLKKIFRGNPFYSVVVNFHFLKILLFLVTTASFAQYKVFKAVDIIEYDSTEAIRVSDGMVYKWTIPDNTTARFFEAVDGEYEMTVTAKKKIMDIKIEAETARVIERAQLDASTGLKTICCVTGTTLTNTRIIFDGEKDTGSRKQIVFNYARGNTGKGKIVVSFTKSGVINSHTFYLDPTGTNVWDVWKEATFDLPPNQVGIMSISTDQPGAWNLDYVVIK